MRNRNNYLKNYNCQPWKTGDYQFQLEFFNTIGSIGITNRFQYTVYDINTLSQLVIEPILTRVLTTDPGNFHLISTCDQNGYPVNYIRWYAVKNQHLFSSQELVPLTGSENQKKLPLFLSYEQVESFENYSFGCARVKENGDILNMNEIVFQSVKTSVHFPPKNIEIKPLNETYFCM